VPQSLELLSRSWQPSGQQAGFTPLQILPHPSQLFTSVVVSVQPGGELQ
jgi:hypothetical protein